MPPDSSVLEFSALSTVQLAHDLQNLLSIMSGCVDSLGSRVELALDDPDLTELVESIDSAFHLSNDILAVVGLHAVRKPVLVDIGELLARYRGTLQRAVGAAVELVITTSETPVLVPATPVQIEWILLNLAANARNAMPDGGVLRIETAMIDRLIGSGEFPVRRDPYVRLTVRDDGGGIMGDIAPWIFEPFYSSDVLGTGLGLTSVAVTVRALEGWLYVENARTTGTSVHVLLPLAPRGSPS